LELDKNGVPTYVITVDKAIISDIGNTFPVVSIIKHALSQSSENKLKKCLTVSLL